MSDPPWTIVAHGSGRFSVVEGLRRQPAFAVRAGAETWIYFDGRVHVIRSASASSRPRGRAASDDDTALSAPMPGTVVAVHVQEGQAVSRGDVLVTLEAMKMELAIRAPRDATVGRIACRPGELVQPGVPLVELR